MDEARLDLITCSFILLAMSTNHLPIDLKRVAFISTRIAGTDGVSLEIEKWARVIERQGVDCYYIAGELDRPDDRCRLIPEMHFMHPEIAAINKGAFNSELRTTAVTDEISRLTQLIRNALKEAIVELEIDGIIVENALTIPMNIPLGIAIVQVIQETGIGCLAHHHDFYWERERFLINSVQDILRYAFPPALPTIQHVAINSVAAESFSRRTGLSCRIVPNVMDFANPPGTPDDYACHFRQEIGLAEDDIIFLQPTRVVERKGIEHAIELVKRLEDPRIKLVITHSIKDEGDEYAHYLLEFAKLMDVELHIVDDRVAEERGTDEKGRKLFTLADTYDAADLVTYPSEYEGFGNAFLEAIYHRKPVFCNRYAIYRADIEPCGFNVVLFDGFLTSGAVDGVRSILNDSQARQTMVDHNYEVARQFFSYEVAEEEILGIISRPQNLYRLVARRRARAELRSSPGRQ
jgi:glycosyltransferase involved in cell wall biosynthesis